MAYTRKEIIAKYMSKKALDYLKSNLDNLLNELKIDAKKVNFSYINFGTAVEPYVKNHLVKIFSKGGFVKNKSDYKESKDKNEFPDFILFSKPPLILEIKTGNRFSKNDGGWEECKNSENDMGTLNSWEAKLKKFGAENIYYILIEYADKGDGLDVIKVSVDNFYKYLDLNKDGFLRYREKDGNLRPKNFTATPKINTIKQFMDLLGETNKYRAKRLVKKHLNSLPEKEKKELLADLMK